MQVTGAHEKNRFDIPKIVAIFRAGQYYNIIVNHDIKRQCVTLIDIEEIFSIVISVAQYYDHQYCEYHKILRLLNNGRFCNISVYFVLVILLLLAQLILQ